MLDKRIGVSLAKSVARAMLKCKMSASLLLLLLRGNKFALDSDCHRPRNIFEGRERRIDVLTYWPKEVDRRL